MNQSVKQSLSEYLRAHRDNMVADLKTLVSYPSVYGPAEGDAPFGLPCQQVLDRALALFAEAGAETENDGNYYGLATYGDHADDIGVFAHLDVVPVEAGWVYTEPFVPVEKEGYLIGRGSRDNKAAVVMALYAIKAIRALNLPLRHNLKIFLGCNEESGMEDIVRFKSAHTPPTVNLVPDSRYPACLGEKGICHLTAKAKQPLRSIVSFEGGIAPNVILETAVVKMPASPQLEAELTAAMGDNPAYRLSREGELLVLSAVGLTAHGSRPAGSVNGAKLAVTLLLALPSLPQQDREVLQGMAAVLASDNGQPLGIAAQDAYFGETTATNGIVRLAEGYLSMTLDIRYGTETDPDYLYATVCEHLDRLGFTVTQANNRHGFRMEESHPVAQAMMAVYRDVSGEPDAKAQYSSGGTYARYLPNAVSFGVDVPYLKGTLPFLPGHGSSHQSDEAIYIDSMVESCRIMTLMILALDQNT
ncbi:MAG: Sapep family Mn(2+)-dependent dipeptidase [Eubacteriales bacterium]